MAYMILARNHTDFLYQAIELVLEKGKPVSPRNMDVLEVEDVMFCIERPVQKQLLVPLRGNNPIATMAEVLWVMAGRDDMEYLTYYLPRAIEFSDDGERWRGGYGPRLRDWNGIDQVKEVVKILEADRDSRRAVMMIYDPDRDFVASKDIPCNNQLAFTIRGDKLNMKACSRSMDIIWGSNVNITTWSVLQEIIAGIMGVEPGALAYFVSSFHLYTSFIERAKAFLHAKDTGSEYFGHHTPILKFDIFSSVSQLDAWLSKIMGLEEQIRKGRPLADVDELDFVGRQMINMFEIRRYLFDGALDEAKRILNQMEDTDFSRAIMNYVELGRL